MDSKLFVILTKMAYSNSGVSFSDNIKFILIKSVWLKIVSDLLIKLKLTLYTIESPLSCNFKIISVRILTLSRNPLVAWLTRLLGLFGLLGVLRVPMRREYDDFKNGGSLRNC
jgi:hypothetical protein